VPREGVFVFEECTVEAEATGGALGPCTHWMEGSARVWLGSMNEDGLLDLETHLSFAATRRLTDSGLVTIV